MSELMIAAYGLIKHYTATHARPGATITALDGIDLEVASGTIYALLGPNGAGKTTAINILTTLTQPSAGTARVAGYDVLQSANEVRQRIGVTFQDLILDPDLSGRQVLDIHGRLYNLSRELRRKRIEQLVELIQLGDVIDRLIKTYSGGMKRRLELARGLMTDPVTLFLDEPTQGLDPQNRAIIWDYIRTLKHERGLTLLLSTHYMEEAETLADTVGIIDHGRKIVEGAPSTLVSALGADRIRLTGRGDIAQLVTHLQQLSFIDSVACHEQSLEISVDHGGHRIAEIVAQASQNGYVIEDISVVRPSLGDVFLKHTGRALRN